jgi:quinol monooxygenase YgiN
MFARLIETTAKPGKREEVIAFVMKNLLPVIKNQPGFVGVIGHLSDTSPDETAGMSYWKSKADAERFFGSAEFGNIFDGIKPLIADMKVRTFTVRASTFDELAAG